MRVVSVVGARPQFIKAAVVSRELRSRPGVTEFLLHTGQHYDATMSAVFFTEMDIPEPDADLGIGSGTHGAQTGRMLEGIEGVLAAESPDWVLVYGDTNSTLAGALAAVKLHLPVAHVEAGLRSFNRAMPEEINRVVADHVADLLLAPTETAASRLAAEGIPAERISVVGDVMLDAAQFYGARAGHRSHILEHLALPAGGFVLATLHRAENTDDPARLSGIVAGLTHLAARLPVVLPLHPRTAAALDRHGLRDELGGVRLIEPVGYLDMVQLERHARLIVTDSGGVQKEAFFHGVPCVTLRDETEWTELIELGWNRLLSPGSGEPLGPALAAALEAPPGQVAAPYGRGDAAARIVDRLAAT